MTCNENSEEFQADRPWPKGILPGDRLLDRAALLADPLQLRPVIADLRARMKELLGTAVEVARARFGGKLSYASVPLDGVDWGLFDIISTDAGYRTAHTAASPARP